VAEPYLQTYREWSPGETYQRSRLDAFEKALMQTGLFRFVAVKPAAESEVGRSGGSDSGLPIVARLEEAKHRTFGGGLRLSTNDGPGARAFVEHRNFFGANETARLSATAGLFEQDVSLEFRKPQFPRPRDTLVSGVTLRHVDDDAFEEVRFQINAGIEREVSERLLIGAGGLVNIADIKDGNRIGRSNLFGLPLTAAYDASDDLLDPSKGFRLFGALTPFIGTFEEQDLLFTVFEFKGAVYRALSDDKRWILALRGRLGSIFGNARDEIPPPQRLYSGGGGSVRGYDTRFIGPLDSDGDPVGGRSVAELGAEARLRLTSTIGLVPFVEAGTVSDAMFPDLDKGVQYAVGLGLRYYTIVGPIRADFAVPLNPRDEDDAFHFYIAIGQAF
jgi:translocation and assembly module TamA